MENEGIEIDERFKTEEGEHFHSCMVCQRALLNSDEDYFIERVFGKVEELDLDEVLFEYAMCLSCAENLRKELSKESLEAIDTYFLQRIRPGAYFSISDRLESCLLTDKDIGQAKEYSLHAHCRGDRMLPSVFPYAISDEAMDEISDLLSDETTDQLDDFKGKYFSGPPEVMDLINPND